MARPLLRASSCEWSLYNSDILTFLPSFQTLKWPGLSPDWMSWLGPGTLTITGMNVKPSFLKLKIRCSIKQLVTGILQLMINVALGLLARVARMDEPGALH